MGLNLTFPSCSHVASTGPSAVFFRHTCWDIRSILHRCSRCQGLQAGSPPLPPGTPRTGGCRARGWPTPPAPRRTSSPATRPRPSSRPSARSSCGCPKNRPPRTTSTADGPRLAFAKYPLPVEARLRGDQPRGCQQEDRRPQGWGPPEQGSKLQFEKMPDAISHVKLTMLLLSWQRADHLGSR